MVSLFNLKLDNNHLSGSIPPEFKKFSNLENLNLASNDLSCSIHGALGECLKLLNLNLSNNRFGENIPILQSLDLSHNLVTGTIPQQIGELQILETLNLSQNELSGSLQSSFNNMLSLTLVDVSYNNMLSFRVPYHRLPETVALRKASFETLKRKIVHENIIEEPENFSAKHCVGKEGSGIVYRANLPTGQGVAVKKLHASPVGDLVNLKGFTSEIRALTEIRYHNIVKLYGYSSHPRHSFLVYEFLNFMAIVYIQGTHCHASSLVTTPHTHQINQQYKILNLNL
ncbi:hypothetical protein ACSBR2_024639 [Camellia fascicularis]